jgi:hypothetical protein
MMSRNDSWHRKISTGRHFQNGRHSTAQIQHCPISTTFHMWVDYDVSKWFLTSKNFYRSPFSKWPSQYRTNSTLFDFNVLNWFPTLKNFYRSPFSKWLPNTAKIQHCSISTSWIDSRHWKISTGLHFQNGQHNIAKIQHCSISKVAFNLFFKPVVCGRFGRLHNR